MLFGSPVSRRFSRPIRAVVFSAVGAVVAACAMTPTLSFSPDDLGDSGATPDATTDAGSTSPHDGAIDSTPVTDAGGSDGPTILSDDAGPIIDDDDAGIDANTKIACHGGFVSSCQNCQGATLRCTLATTDSCVSDCTGCGNAVYACLHCAPNGNVRGKCLAPNANGRLACSDANRCPCTAGDPSACPVVAGSAETCLADPIDGGAPSDAGGKSDAGHVDAAAPSSAGHCFTCGEPKSQQSTCERADGTTGICKLASGTPTCK